MKRRNRNRIRRRRIGALLLVPVGLVATTTTITFAAAQTAAGPALDSEQRSVLHGNRATLRGTGFTPGAPVGIEFQRAGAAHWAAGRTVEANAAGAFSTRVRPRYSGSYRAVPAGGEPTSVVPAHVRSRVRLDAKRWTVVGRKLKLSGRAQPATRRRVRIRARGDTVRTRTDARGRFSAKWRADRTGRFRPSARVAGNELAAGGSDRGRRVTVYRPARASWYGPGLYGNRMACGGTLGPGTLGVAHKTLPCGTRVHLRYRGRTAKARVVDRGPYAGNREFDLTAATRRKLGFGSTGTVLSSK